MFRDIKGATLDRILDNTPGTEVLKNILRYCVRGDQSVVILGDVPTEIIDMQKAIVSEVYDRHLLTGLLNSDEDAWLFVRAMSVMPVTPVMGSLCPTVGDLLERMKTTMVVKQGMKDKQARWLVANSVDIVIVLEKRDGIAYIAELLEVSGSDNGFITTKLFDYVRGELKAVDPPTTTLYESVRKKLKGDMRDAFTSLVETTWNGSLTEVDNRNKAARSNS